MPVLRFSLDAARVAKANNPGNRQGLDAVVGGQKVRLMMYYTIRSIPRTLTRITTYAIFSGKVVIFRNSFKGQEKPGDTGRAVRYTYWIVPANLSPKLYDFSAVLTIGGRSQTRSWRFGVVRTGAVTIRTSKSAAF